jgi:hypothetical protein
MASKAKSGLSAVRQFPEKIIEPPNTYVIADPSFTGAIRDGKGHSAIHAGVTNNTIGTLRLLQAWRSTGPFVQVASIVTAADPVTGFHTAEIVCPISRRFTRILFSAAAPGLGADFEIGSYFEPRSDSTCQLTSGGVPVVPPPLPPPPPTPGTTITTPANTPLPAGTVALPVAPVGTRRVRVQVTGGSALTEALVREVGAGAGTGILLQNNGSTLYGGVDGAIAALEVQLLAGPAVVVRVQFEG